MHTLTKVYAIGKRMPLSLKNKAPINCYRTQMQTSFPTMAWKGFQELESSHISIPFLSLSAVLHPII